ncbi:MAG: DegV domain-containing protein [Chloroflexi bacterium ADurb.Bin325]|nr:MAG: DegV domain-containing protein [Chloroflexi bacterium ADurb.Bin325]
MIRIVTDSTCEAPPELMAHPRVAVVPLSVVFGQTSLRDGVEISREEFWRRLPSSDPLPTTSQAVPSDFLTPFEQFCAAGDEVVAITISSKLSGTYAAALAAQQTYPYWPISVVDSLSTSIGLGMLLDEAVRLAEAGKTRAEIVERLTAMREKLQVVFVLETLEYLQKGGRIGKAQAFVGTLLKFKPLLQIADGEIGPVARARSRAKALETAQEYLLNQVPARGPQVRLALTQALAADEARALGDKLAAAFGASGFYVADLGPVLGVHVGPGAIGVGVYGGD